MSPPPVVDVYYSFRSPYSYLAAPRLASWLDKYHLEIRFRPVLPLVIRKPEFFQKANPLLFKYIEKIDTPRVAAYLGLPFHWPNPDPVSVHLEDGVPTMSKEQPYIYRLTYLGVLAVERGRGVQFAKEVSTLVWSTDDWHKGSHLADAVKRAGLDLDEMDGVVEREGERLRTIVDANLEALSAAGHWGVPSCVVNGEVFFGQDRLDLVLWRLRQNGLKEKTDSV